MKSSSRLTRMGKLVTEKTVGFVPVFDNFVELKIDRMMMMTWYVLTKVFSVTTTEISSQIICFIIMFL